MTFLPKYTYAMYIWNEWYIAHVPMYLQCIGSVPFLHMQCMGCTSICTYICNLQCTHAIKKRYDMCGGTMKRVGNVK